MFLRRCSMQMCGNMYDIHSRDGNTEMCQAEKAHIMQVSS